MSKGRALGLSTTYGRKRVNVAATGTFLPDGHQTDELGVFSAHFSGGFGTFVRPLISGLFDLEDRRV